MPKKIPPEIDELITRYRKAQDSIIKIILEQETKGNNTVYRKQLLSSIQAELDNLDKFADDWLSDKIPKAYQKGVMYAYNKYRDMNVFAYQVAANKNVIDTMILNASGQLKTATRFVGRRLDDEIRKAGTEAVAQKVLLGDTVKQTKNNLINNLSQKGITTIRDRRGREIRLDAYSGMVARTTTREATNKGCIQEVQGINQDLVQVTQHFSTCPICATYEGRVYSISGTDSRYPKLDDMFSNGYSTIHPNCTHSIVPYIREFDDDAEGTQKQSNRPYELTNEQKKSVDAYYKDQARKAELNRDRNTYNLVKIQKPTVAPKTFSAFRRIKSSSPDKFKEITKGLIRPTTKISPVSSVGPSALDKLTGKLTWDTVEGMPEGELRSLGKTLKSQVKGSKLTDEEVKEIYTLSPSELKRKIMLDWQKQLVGMEPKVKAPIIKPVVKAEPRVFNVEEIKTLKNLNARQEEYINKRRIHLGSNKYQQVKKSLEQMVENSAIRIRVPSQGTLEKILNSGRFKTQFETHSSEGALSPKARKEVCNKLFGTETKGMKNDEYEIYGYLGNKSIYEDIGQPQRVSHYGRYISVELKKDIAKRTTFTIGDSLDPGLNERMVASSMTDIKPVNVRSLEIDDIPQASSKEKVTPNAVVNKTYCSYIEAQYHGGVTLDDIDIIYFYDEKPSQKIIKILKEKGIKSKYINIEDVIAHEK